MLKFIARIGFCLSAFLVGAIYASHADTDEVRRVPPAVHCKAVFELMAERAPDWSAGERVRLARAAWAMDADLSSVAAEGDPIDEEKAALAAIAVRNPVYLTDKAAACVVAAPWVQSL